MSERWFLGIGRDGMKSRGNAAKIRGVIKGQSSHMDQRPLERFEELIHLAPSKLDFFDEQTISLRKQLSALEIYRKLTDPLPWIFRLLIRLRDALGRPFGLKPIRGFGQSTPYMKDGVRYLDFFEVKSLEEKQLHLLATDHHLAVLLSIQTVDAQRGSEITVTARVSCKNLIGHLYMQPVRVVHRWITRHMLEQLKKSTEADATSDSS